MLTNGVTACCPLFWKPFTAEGEREGRLRVMMARTLTATLRGHVSKGVAHQPCAAPLTTLHARVKERARRRLRSGGTQPMKAFPVTRKGKTAIETHYEHEARRRGGR